MRQFRALFVWIFATALVSSGSAAAVGIDFGRYNALVIGINDYKHLPRLETAVNDASAVHDLLRREYGFASKLLLNPRRGELVRALDVLRAELTEKDNLLIYYAGHGFLDRITNEGFWLPVDAELGSQVEWVSVSTVTRMLKASSAKHALVVADSCYSGTLTRNAPILLETGAEREAELMRITMKRARKALTSGGLEPVADGGGDGHSVFTRALLEALRGNREVMDGYQLYRTLRRRVVMGAEQTPQYSEIRFAGDEGGDFLFVPAALTRARPKTPPTAAIRQEPSETAIEVLFWRSIQSSEAASDYEAYLEQYPKGRFAALARGRIARLGARRNEPSPTPVPAPAPPPQPQAGAAAEIAFWESVKDADEPAPLNAYLGAYPAGRFVEIARLRIAKLERQAAVVPAPKPTVSGVADDPRAALRTYLAESEKEFLNEIATYDVQNAILPSGYHGSYLPIEIRSFDVLEKDGDRFKLRITIHTQSVTFQLENVEYVFLLQRSKKRGRSVFRIVGHED